MGIGMASKLQALGLKKIKDKDLARPRFPIGLDMKRIVRPLAGRPLLSQIPEVSKVPKSRARVAFFTGCMLNYIYTQAGRAVIEVLNANGVDVVTPREQHCCGIPVLVNGDVKTAKEIAKYNLDVFARGNYDAIITHCGSCIGAWVHHYHELLADEPRYGALAKELSAKAFDVSQYLVDKLGMREPLAKLNYTVTYHDPCHMVRGVGISQQPRKVIRNISGVTLKEMKKPDRCCGSAGSFSLSYYELSGKIRDKKVTDILSVNPDIVLTSCGACRMQLEEGLYRAGSDIPVRHVVEVLAEAYAKEGGVTSERKTG